MTLGAGSTGAQARQCLCALRYVAAVSVRSNVDYKCVFILDYNPGGRRCWRLGYRVTYPISRR